MSPTRLAPILAVLAAAGLLAGCAAQAAPALTPAGTSTAPASTPAVSAPASATAEPAPSMAPSVTTRELTDGILTDFYRPGVMSVLRVPAAPGPTPLVVVVPGGGWKTSDPVDYRPLAEALTADGISTALITYDTSETGAQFPLPIDDVACAVRWSAFQLEHLGYPPSAVYVVGHSAGGQLAVEAAVGGERFGGDCAMPPVRIDGVAGVAGVYDLSDPNLAAPELFPEGGTAAERSEYSPITLVGDPGIAMPPLRVMLLSGANDVIVPATQPEQLAAALRARGIEPQVQVLPMEHNMGFPLALEIAPIIAQWVLGDAYVPPASATPSPPAPASAAPAPPASAVPPAPESAPAA